MSMHFEASIQQRHRRPSPTYSEESASSTHMIFRSGSDVSDDGSVNYLAHHLKQTASFDYNQNRNSYHSGKENESYVQHEFEKGVNTRINRSNRNAAGAADSETNRARDTLENNYSRAMSQMNRGDYGPGREKKQQKKSTGSKESDTRQPKRESTRSREAAPAPSRRSNRNGMDSDRRNSQCTVSTQVSNASTTKPVPIEVKKRSVSKKHPSEETIAIFGAYGVTGGYFMQRALEAGYNLRIMLLPGMELDDASASRNVRVITGSLGEIDKVRQVVKNATYVVCLLNDCDHENFNPPLGNGEEGMGPEYYDFNNLNFMHNLVPILEDSDKCRVLLYEASSLSKDNKGSAPFLSKMAKKMAVGRDWRNAKKEQDQIVKYITHQTKNAHFNYVVTRPSGAIWDKPSRKKLAASKSQPGPFPITNTDLAEFTLNALKMQKVYNTCPYVVQDGI